VDIMPLSALREGSPLPVHVQSGLLREILKSEKEVILSNTTLKQ
jgi:hypothetical protein